MIPIICKRCKLPKSKDEMTVDNRVSHGHTTTCKACRRKLSSDYRKQNRQKVYESGREYRKRNKRKSQDYELCRKYGISIDDYDRMSVMQGHKCAICGSQNPGKNNSRFCVDHDHVTGQVRALLCGTCNRGIGFMQDDPDLLEKAADYIRTFRGME